MRVLGFASVLAVLCGPAVASSQSPGPGSDLRPGAVYEQNAASTLGEREREAAARPRDFGASQLIGNEVRNHKDEKIGAVEDVLINQIGSVKGVVVSVGEFLGMDERKVALDWAQLTLHRDGDNIAISVTMTKSQLEHMPPHDSPAAR